MNNTESAPATAVVFRKWPSGDIIALFPESASDAYGYYCDSYEHIGGHGGADYSGVVRATTPANEEEAASLKEELARIGYNLKVLKRATASHHDKRRKEAREYRECVLT